jgi:decaprenylphospho-beta-D-erythro-pentofuranosid-2-ulose 2-reductase
MEDALGSFQSVLVLGGASEIAAATVIALIEQRCRTVVLAVRDPGAVDALAADLRRRGAETVEVVAFDASRHDTHDAVVDDVFDRVGDIDLTIVAFGVLGEQATFDADPVAAGAAVDINYVGAVTSGLAVARRIRAQGHGTILFVSSVAAIRARASNFVYGSSKAGLDAFAQGLGDHLVAHGGRVSVVRPGFVRSRMTEGMPAQPFATTPEAVAAAIVTGLQKNQEIIWAPGILRLVFGIMRVLPRPVWRIVSAR